MMRGPVIAIAATVTALGLIRSAHAGPCTAPTPACAAQLPPRAAEPSPAPPRPALKKLQPPRRVDPGKREAFMVIGERTARCMDAGTSARVRAGSRDRPGIGRAIVGSCGRELYDWLQRESGFTEAEARQVVEDFAELSLRAELKAPPPAPPRPANRALPAAKERATPEIASEDGEFLSIFKRTARCMHQGAAARVRSGDRDEHSIGHMIVNACGQELYDRLRKDGTPEDEAVDLLDRMTVEATRNELAGAPPARPAAATPLRSTEPPIKYDWEKAKQRETRLQIEAQTVACMREGAAAMLQMGQRDRASIRSWVAGTCSASLKPWLVQREGSSEEADAALLRLADEAIGMALRGPDAILVR